MKKLFIILHLLFTVISIALAQPATAQRDNLYVEILTDPNCTEPGNYHFPNDSSLLCPLGWQCFKTNYDDGTYWHTWETSLGHDDYTIFGQDNRFFLSFWIQVVT